MHTIIYTRIKNMESIIAIIIAVLFMASIARGWIIDDGGGI